MTARKYKRRKKLIKPHLQLKLTFTFVGLSALSLLLQFVLFTNSLTTAALDLPNDGLLLLEQANTLLLEVLLFSFLAFLPMTFALGIITTFRIAGPVYRFEMFLNSIERGECPPDFRLRKHDDMKDLAALLNRVTRPLRQPEAASPYMAGVDPETAPSLLGTPAPNANAESKHNQGSAT